MFYIYYRQKQKHLLKGEEYYEFGRGNSDIDEFIKIEDLDKNYILSELINDDMHSASLWIAEENETYEKFAAMMAQEDIMNLQ